jgi:hypothetical protein
MGGNNSWRFGIFVAALAAVVATPADAQEVSLYASNGEPVAYIAVKDEMTIYLWGGKPVAYLYEDARSYHVYGFNGRHLGWFESGAIWMEDGSAACALREALTVAPQYEGYKSYKEYKPYRAYRSYAPYKPYLSNKFGAVPCAVFLAGGSD